MGMGVDYIAANNAIEELDKLLSDIPHGERENIADDIIDFVEKMKNKYQINDEVNDQEFDEFVNDKIDSSKYKCPWPGEHMSHETKSWCSPDDENSLSNHSAYGA